MRILLTLLILAVGDLSKNNWVQTGVIVFCVLMVMMSCSYACMDFMFWARLFKAGLRQPRVSEKSDFRSKRFERKFR